ncbi:MAG: hypothetical protein Ct9H300mP20_05690 [Gammaproteobacteria bacterium]|nr:MAG: hypothetical protein Ct9H300mP20_05690 [Gammaproteobacteria bacterium]
MNKLLTTTITILSLFLALEFSAGVGGEESSTTSVDQLDWLTGQREGSHDGGILEQTWLPPRSGTITALVRSTKESDTRFVEIIHIREINGSLELNLQIFNNSLEPENISATYSRIHKFELTEVGDRYLALKGVSDGLIAVSVISALKEIFFPYTLKPKCWRKN